MISELDCRILAKACGMCWHDYKIGDGFVSTCSCGRRGCIVREFCGSANPTFTTPDDWELVRVKVVVPNIKEFDDFEWDRWMTEWKDTDTKNFFSWWSIKTPQDRCNEGLLFIKSCPDLFPWAEMMEEKK